MTKRNLWKMAGLMIITLGLYSIYWIVVTKLELNQQGAQIPTSWLLIIPLANIYFVYKFAEAFSIFVLKSKKQTVAYFLLLLILWPIGELIYQAQINELAS